MVVVATDHSWMTTFFPPAFSLGGFHIIVLMDGLINFLMY